VAKLSVMDFTDVKIIPDEYRPAYSDGIVQKWSNWQLKIPKDHLRSSTHGQAKGYSMSVVDVNF